MKSTHDNYGTSSRKQCVKISYKSTESKEKFGKTLEEYNLPKSTNGIINQNSCNQELLHEMQYNRDKYQEFILHNETLLNNEQRAEYDCV